MAITIHGEMARGADGLTTIMNRHQTEMSKSIEKISTGLKINHAGDDSAGNAISEKMRTQLRALDQSDDNTQSAGALLGVADAAVMSMLDVVTEMHVKATEALGTIDDDSRQILDSAIKNLRDEIISEGGVSFNGRRLFDGNWGRLKETIDATTTYLGNYDNDTALDGKELHFANMTWSSEEDDSMYFQVGPEPGDGIKAHFMNMDELFDGLFVDLTSKENAEKTAKSLDKVTTRLLYQISEIGSLQERLEFTSSNLQMVNENTQSALSVIQDADIAKEMTNFVKNNVLMQATQAMMAQANTTLASFVNLLQPVE